MRRRKYIPIGLLAASLGFGILRHSISCIHAVVPPTLLRTGCPCVVTI